MLRLLARALRATNLIDRAYHRFSRMRSTFVLSHASSRFYDLYNDVAYGNQGAYRLGSQIFRKGLFPWEQRAVARHFPPPPAHVLIGAAGGGREALALAGMGYRITAFEPASRLANSMRAQMGADAAVRVFTGRYEDVPFVESLEAPPVRIDLRTLGRFDAIIFGWASLSHLRTDQHCVETLRSAAALSDGPILVSYFSRPHPDRTEAFSIDIGYYREFSAEQFENLVARAGLLTVEHDHEGGWPNAVLRRVRSDDGTAGGAGNR